MADPFAASSNSHDPPVAVAQVNHLPIVADFARRLGLVEIVNRLVPVDMQWHSLRSMACGAPSS